MAKTVKFGTSDEDTSFGAGLIEALQEAIAWKRGELELTVVSYPSITADRVKTIRKAVAKSPKDFAKRFGIPARTLEGWEQGRRHPDPAAVTLLRVIEKNPEVVEAVVRKGSTV
jgi:putative transcriptional regulator